MKNFLQLIITKMHKTRTKPKSAKPQQWQQKPQLSITKNPKILIPILISTLKSPHNPSSKPLLKPCSTKLLIILQQNSSSLLNTHLNTILAIIPIMMNSQEIIGTAVKIIGVLTLFSMEVNQMIADESGLLKGLVLKVVIGCGNLDLRIRLVNVLLDVCVTCLGKRRLLEVSGLNYVMHGFIQVKKSASYSNFIIIIEKDGNLYLGAEHSQEKLHLLLLTAAVTLTNFCNTGQLKLIPRKLIGAFSPYVKEFWCKVHKKLLASEVMNYSKDKYCYLSNITVYNFAESIFRLSIDCSTRAFISDNRSGIIIGHLFGTKETDFKKFMLENWESSPFLMRRRGEDTDIFSSFMGSLTTDELMPEFLVSLLQGMISCPPIASDEINGLNFLNDARDTLGCPLIYQQDIRVVKTNSHSRKENHYFQEMSEPFSFDDILKCGVAYREGYTIAIRGMECRLTDIATITRLVANLFGQPSVGANLYITPPDSQGLACHYDDHCVFVCQIRGSKEWRVSPQSTVQLPRLYEQLEAPQELVMDSRLILLNEGDVLYIPRGFAHEAQTVSGDGERSENSKFSAHLTLAIEVEPPFEWEGFTHLALHGWNHGKQTDNPANSFDITQSIYVNILHVAIRLISQTEPVFRKACLVSADTFPEVTNDWLDENQRAVFNQVINKVYELANFKVSVNLVKMALQKNENPFQWLGWLEHLNEIDAFDYDMVDSDLAEINKIILCIGEDMDKAKYAFEDLKSKFCNEVVFDDARDRFKGLHDRYKEGRLQFMNGMLSLHY